LTGLPTSMHRTWAFVVFVLLIALQTKLDAAGPGDNQSSSAVSQPSPETSPSSTLAPVMVAAEANTQIQQVDPTLGARTYTLGAESIDDQGQGADSGFDQILLHAPGISRESSGQFHLRAEDYGLQYRLNGILLPDGITSTLGQPFDSRLIEKLTVISGALPAEYGLRNAGVIDLETKTGSDLDGQEVSLYGGSHGTLHPSFSSGGVSDGTEYFFSGAYLQDDLGTDNVTGSSKAIHDQTQQFQGFALVSHEIAPGQKLSVILSGINSAFQIPNAPGLLPTFDYEGVTHIDSSNLNRNQREQNYYGIIAYQVATPELQVRLAEINGYSSTHYLPDHVGDLMFTGAASDAKRDLLSTGIQFDLSYEPDQANTLKTGVIVTTQLERSHSNNAVFPADSAGNVSSDTPETINESEHQRGVLYGAYVENQWQPVGGLTVNYGARLDFSNAYIAEHQFSPRINFAYKLTQAFTVHAGYARIFSPPILEYIRPSFLTQFLHTSDAPLSLNDAVPQAERSHSFAAGVTYQPNSHFSAGVDAYYKIVRNMQDETQLGESLIFTPFSYEHGRKLGVELTASYQQGGLLVYSNVAIARSEGLNINSSQGLFDPSEVAYVAAHYIHTDYDQLLTVSSGASYQWNNLTLHTDLLAGSGMYGGFANSQQLDGHWTLNLGIDYRFLLHNKAAFTARFDVINLFDRRYLLHDAGVGATVDQFGDRRGFFGGIACDF
jgi:outer membrane receptor protein involved in Fe transport